MVFTTEDCTKLHLYVDAYKVFLTHGLDFRLRTKQLRGCDDEYFTLNILMLIEFVGDVLSTTSIDN